ncbi:centrosome-associated protein CEP250-like [Anarrhichthys ocellatus]|uniref:centrosome-associated protein CEP250-like n=1 Tax=Anarrhichthys ocellatus TaxID=433405 RepID=UPI0012EEA716|nr:centrosome-associated protein CEP250-like [Anarrhichthys ocellatus]
MNVYLMKVDHPCLSVCRDLLQLRAEFSRLSSSLLSSCDSVSSSLRLIAPPIKPFSSAPPPLLPSDLTPLSSTLVLPPPDSSSSLPPLTSSSTMGTFSLGELEHREEQEEEEERWEEKEREISELKLVHETKVFQLTERIEELSRSLQAEDRQKEVQRHEDTERSLQSVSQAVVKLSRVLSSSRSMSVSTDSVSTDSVLSLDLSSLLSVLSHTESALQWRHEELQGAALSLRRLGEEKTAVQLRLKQLEDDNQLLQTHSQHTQLELTHTVDLLSREREVSSSLHLRLEEVQREKERLRRERDRQEERDRQLETETLRRVKAEAMEKLQLTETETLQRMEIFSLKGALERQQLDTQRAGEEAADARDALQKSRDRVLCLSSSECVLRREVEEGRDSLDKMATLNWSLALDKKELSKQLLKLECELSDSQSQLQTVRSEVTCLQREVRTLNLDSSQLRAQREEEVDVLCKEEEVTVM